MGPCHRGRFHQPREASGHMAASHHQYHRQDLEVHTLKGKDLHLERAQMPRMDYWVIPLPMEYLEVGTGTR
jgi:hypothetical protein